MKKKILLILTILIISSCKEKVSNENLPIIEIYLTKETIKNSKGIPVEEFILENPNEKDILKPFENKNFTIDTSSGNLICCSEFNINKNELKEKPLLTNKEIIGFNFNNSSIYISKSGIKKIMNLPNSNSGHQFSLCINGEPKLNGYFLTSSSKYLPDNYHFSYSYAINEDNLKFDYYAFGLTYGNQIRTLDSINEKAFHEAMKISNRIIK